MNFKHLNTFSEVAECSSFSLAADRLHTVQSAVSRHINALEEELGVILFERSTRRVELTAPGQAFLIHAKAILSKCEQAKHEAQLVAQGKQGVLRIGYMSSACAHFLPTLLSRFTQYAPKVDVQIFDMTAGEQVIAFASNAIDIGFSRPVDSGHENLIQRQHLVNDTICLAVNNEHLLSQKSQVALEELAPFPLILFSRTHAPSLFDTLITAFHRADIQPKIQSEPTSMQALLTQIASSNSVALVPSCVRNLQTHHCSFINLNIELTIPLEMHWHAEPTATAKTWLDWYASQDQSATLTPYSDT
ncbi:HTH-type transcriptional regulator BenM [Zhongshania aliphaticivorans]|uniref:HTH-type transcriptional regulator BenM n=1 Tax=Zhongshania aliphaticivorans TaxID=1470434 RepID=A0A5S9Q2F0_9GAMM|nr:LysR family transcriptional regulator [Zhongshania aliphaticivorans]CAA0111052.1 HTH-type transcriptional regulator BenM [Zhongshania aliphaticivorans]CAA0118420.1 HTH-type transcriptional regulator BenM [Zhongshania aliphaticivorans]CAA0122440.1 HTH-type transcriptional regulator BenM [Zhongshania aliphaticivorans]